MKKIEETLKEQDRNVEIMGTPSDEAPGVTPMAWGDRVGWELGMAYRKVSMEDDEEILRRGIRFEGEFLAKNILPEEWDRIMKLATGSDFRK